MMSLLAVDPVARCAALVRYAERRRGLAYGLAVACVALGVVARLALLVVDVPVVPLATLFPAIAAAAFVGGAGPGFLALALSAGAGALILQQLALTPGPFGTPGAINTVLLVVTGGLLVGLGTLARAALLRLAVGDERLSLAISSTGLGIWDVDSVTRSRRWSPEFRAILGLAADAPADPDLFSSLIHPEDRAWVNDSYRAAYDPATDGRYHAEFRIRRAADGVERWVATTGRVYFDPSGRPVRAAGTMVDVTPRLQAEVALRESEERYRTLLETAPDAVHVHRDGVIIFANRQAAALFGAARPDDLIGLRALDFVDPVSLDLARSRTARLNRPGQRNVPVELIIRRLDGSSVPVEANSAAVVLDGRLAVQAVVRDITERKANEAQQALMAREIDHRARNALSVVLSLVRLTRFDNPQAFARAIEDRVGALARVHTLISESRWQDAELAALLEEELAPYRAVAAVSTSGPPVRLAARAMQPLALVIHELTANALRHGALSAASGQLAVSWAVAPDGSLDLLWQERGGPALVGPPDARGFGLTLIEASMRSQLGGNLVLAWEPAGLTCRLRIAASMLAPAGGPPAGRAMACSA